MTQIPIYRAKKIDSDEYVEGFYVYAEWCNTHFIHVNINSNQQFVYEIDTSTLAIHFQDMLDSQGNKIFASLSEDGKGGDCTSMDNGYNETFYWDNLNACIVLKSKHYECRLFKAYNSKEPTFNKYTILGIQQ